ncbi:hypothetical protein [Vibrio crassostreae]|uniref:hypothetical protein n=1 Tax=Vibrio crassostreae TaxID=246167 RepID=UPI001B301E88|nr:hypothetical protein [Vibrio crassostreae]
MIVSGVGSTLMAISFYMIESYSFLMFNLFWMALSVYGIAIRKPSESKNERHENSKTALVFLGLVGVANFASLGLLSLETTSWFAVGMYLAAYATLASKLITRQVYMVCTVVGSIASLAYLIDVGNYPSVAHTTFSALVSVYTLFRDGLKGKVKQEQV